MIMTNATNALIDELSGITDKNKYLILSGGSGVGKTFLASSIVENCLNPRFNSQGDLPDGKDKYDYEVEFVPIHPSFSYEDFVSGISIHTEDGSVVFRYEDKLFASLLRRANRSWNNGEDKKYFLILDDIGRGPISGILGDMLPLIEPHGKAAYKISMHDKSSVWITPNVYIIATRSTTVDSAEQFNYGFFRHFYERNIDNDYRYMSDHANTSYSDYDISANAMYYRARRIVIDNLRHRYQLAASERDKYVLGHGIFKEIGTSLLARYQVVPMLKQYVKDGILDKTASASISAFQKLVEGKYSKDVSFADNDRIVVKKKGITPNAFCSQGLTHQPMVNLVTRIKEQGLLDDSDIIQGIMFNPQILVRKKAKLNKVEREFPSPGYLYIEKKNRDIYTYGTTVDGNGKPKRPRFFYSGNKDDVVVVDGIEFAIASEMQPKEYTRWYEDLDSGSGENERYSSSSNSMMFRILRSYYRALEQHYSAYLVEYPGDNNIERLRAYAAQEYKHLVSESRKLHPEVSDEADVNLKANVGFRDVISKLTLFWKNIGETITVGGQTITVEGVYKVDNSKKYEEYSRAMETLGIHQMIMQGPPGTSKTYSAREYLKFMGKKTSEAEPISEDMLDSLQIKSYGKDKALSDWSAANPGEAPTIAWDIVQFHPSYGYEDFVRGIEVSTVKSTDGDKSSVSYDTVNKILGEMAEVASRSEYKDTKFFLVIDEINRANLATVFGELIYGLEYRGKSVATPYTVDDSNKVVLPDNLYILGTMNTADKSIGGIDYAIRRRFLFFSLLPNRETIKSYRIGTLGDADSEKKQREINEKAAILFDRVAELFNPDNLNNEYYKDDVQIGHTYFLVSSDEQLYLRFRYQMLPILREYYKDGMFQFERPEVEGDGWSGLLGCITGDIDVNSDEDKVKDIFEKLIKPE